MKRLISLNNIHREKDAGISGLIEVVIGTIVIFAMVTLSGKLWNYTNEGVDQTDLRAKLNNAIRTRTEEIRQCSLFFEMNSSARIIPTGTTDCRYYRINPNVDVSYSTTYCDTLGEKFHDYLVGNSLNLLGDFNLQSYDSTAPSVIITVTPTYTENILRVSMSAPVGSGTFTKLTSITPYAVSNCAEA